MSYEAFDLILAHEWGKRRIGPNFRLYGGGEYIFHKEPETLRPLSFQAGGEYRSRVRTVSLFDRNLGLGFLAAADARFREDGGWSGDYSLAAGFEFSNPLGNSDNIAFASVEKLRLLLHYYSGRSPNGQFFRRKIEYLGLGVHWNF